MSPPEFSVEWLLGPTDLRTFLSDHWEKRPLTVFRRDETYFRGVLSLEDVDRILSSHDLQHTSVQLVKNGTSVPPPQYTTEIDWQGMKIGGVIDLVKLFAEYQQGATILLDHLHRSWPPLARLCASVERFFSHPTQTNVYLTPPGSRGFAPHFDTHDVFILQAAGSKRWRLYGAPVQLPLPSHPGFPPGADPGPPAAEFELRAGDLLYMPRGFVHEAFTSDSISMHVTLGIKAYTWADLLTEAVQALCERDVHFRRTLPVGFALDGAAADQARAEAAGLARALAEGVRLEDAVGVLAERFVLTRLPQLDGHLTGLTDARRLTPRSRVRKRAWLYRLTSHGDSVQLLYHGKGLTFPRYLEPTLRFILDTETFPVASLPGHLNDDGKVGLARRLVEEGFLRTVAEDNASG